MWLFQLSHLDVGKLLLVQNVDSPWKDIQEVDVHKNQLTAVYKGNLFV